MLLIELQKWFGRSGLLVRQYTLYTHNFSANKLLEKKIKSPDTLDVFTFK